MKNTRIERRTFLKTVSAAAGTAGAGGTLSASAAALQGGGKKVYRLGFIGLGRRGISNLESVLKRDDVKVVALSEVYKPNLEVALKLAPEAQVYEDFRGLIAASDMDAVCISTPDHWHAYMTIEACKAGKDVYVEKPSSVTIEEGQLMVKAARKYNRVVQVGTQQRSGLHFQRVVNMIRSGKIGKINFVRTWNYGNEFPGGIGAPPDTAAPAGLDWDMWLGPAPERPFNANRFGVHPEGFSHFRWFWDYAGGMMTDWGIHLLDIVLWAMDEAGPRVVSAHGGKFILKDNRETPDVIQATFEFPDFVCVYENRITNAQSMFNRGYGILFHGTEGTLFVDRGRWEILPEMHRSGDWRQWEEVGRITAQAGSAGGDSTDAHWANFIECLGTRERPASDIEVGHRSTVTALLGNVSLRSRQRVDWDPGTETTSNAEAKSYLSREYREPWKLTL